MSMNDCNHTTMLTRCANKRIVLAHILADIDSSIRQKNAENDCTTADNSATNSLKLRHN